MNALPSSIENSLVEAGFSGTEILIIKNFVQEDAMTLRQLAAKTGKSTGVLDQAMKKLLKKGIIQKENVNGVPKFTLLSLDAIAQWMHQDTIQKRETLLRKYQNFEAFIATLTVDKARPEMEHFDGVEGIEKAYLSLLGKAKEMLAYMPVTSKEEDDPLYEFRIQYFRERRHRGIFTRVIAHNTPLGQRYQSRDMFEYRKTMLVEPEECPIPFEKIIAGDTIACFNHEQKKACFIRYPDLALMERESFCRTWAVANAIAKGQMEPRPKIQVEPAPVSLRTATISMLENDQASKENPFSHSCVAVRR